MTAAIIELGDVTRTYGSPPATALDGINLVIEAGEMVSIVGPSGSGKSTLLNIIGTLDRASSGTTRIASHDVAAMSDAELSGLRAHTMGFVFQQFHLFDGVTALENVATGLLYQGIPRWERRRRAVAALTRVGLKDRVDHHPHQLSGGERQRVAIARALLGDPQLLLADEPTGSLDTASGTEIMDLLHDLHRSGTTIVVITHDRDLAQQTPRRVQIRDGKIIPVEQEASHDIRQELTSAN